MSSWPLCPLKESRVPPFACNATPQLHWAVMHCGGALQIALHHNHYMLLHCIAMIALKWLHYCCAEIVLHCSALHWGVFCIVLFSTIFNSQSWVAQSDLHCSGKVKRWKIKSCRTVKAGERCGTRAPRGERHIWPRFLFILLSLVGVLGGGG